MAICGRRHSLQYRFALLSRPGRRDYRKSAVTAPAA